MIVVQARQVAIDIEALHAEGLLAQIDEFAETLRSRIDENPDNVLRVMQLFQSVHPYLHRKFGAHRLVAKIQHRGGRPVLVLHRVFHRTNQDFRTKVLHDPSSHQSFIEMLDDDELRTPQIQASAARPPRNAAAPTTMSPLWYEPLPQVALSGQDLVIYETQEWISAIERREFRASLSSLKDRLINIAQSCRQRVDGDTAQDRDPSTGFYVVHTAFPSHNALVLHEPSATELSDIEIDELRKKFEGGDEAIRAHGRRAYPYWILADYSLWQSIEDGGKSNLALSPEELAILEGVSSNADNLPLIIDGRAGSGKSTMLSFIFASLYLRQAEVGGDEVPVFLSYNKRLLDSSRRNVRGILKSNAQVFVQSKTREATTRNLDTFLTFQEYLFEHLSLAQRDTFPESHYVSYSIFKNAYQKQPPASKLVPPKIQLPSHISAEFAWFGIRQFIKGLFLPDGASDFESLDELGEAFEGLSSKARTISFDDLTTIYQEVYCPWYKVQLSENSLWDDQDLVRQALRSLGENERHTTSRIPGRVAAIVCDEVQDFSQQDLQFIVNSSHLLRTRPTGRTSAFPLIFAGDPMQTLSPSGFRWARLKSQMWESLASLGVERPINVRTLRYNYRSRGDIVRFSNSIQALRRDRDGARQDETDYEPATPWGQEAPASTEFSHLEKFIVNDTDDLAESQLRDISQFLRDAAVLVPCEEGGEGAYILGNKILKTAFSETTTSNVPELVFSASLAKGLEFDNVVLFNFGDALAKIEEENRARGFDFPQRFLLNKLYVSATRAIKNLIIIDTRQGDERLWKKFESSNIADLLRNVPTPEHRARYGTLATVHELRPLEPEAANELADRLFEEASATSEAALFEKALYYFRKSRDTNGMIRCQARLHEVRGEWQEAADRWETLRSSARADRRAECRTNSLNALWRGRHWKQFCDLAESDNKHGQGWRSKAAAFMARIDTADSEEYMLDFLAELNRQLNNDRRPLDAEVLTSDSWSPILDAASLALLQKELPANANELLPAFEYLHERVGYRVRAVFGNLKYSVNDIKGAGRLWSTLSDNDQKRLNQERLRRALALHRGLPEGFVYLRPSDDVKLIEWCEEDPSNLGSEDWFDPYIQALIRQKNFQKARDRILVHRKFKHAAEVLKGLVRDWNEGGARASNFEEKSRELVQQSIKEGRFEVLETIPLNLVLESGENLLMTTLVEIHDLRGPTNQDLIDLERRHLKAAVKRCSRETRKVPRLHPLFVGALYELCDRKEAFFHYETLGEDRESTIQKESAERRLVIAVQEEWSLKDDERSSRDFNDWSRRRKKLVEVPFARQLAKAISGSNDILRLGTDKLTDLNSELRQLSNLYVSPREPRVPKIIQRTSSESTQAALGDVHLHEERNNVGTLRLLRLSVTDGMNSRVATVNLEHDRVIHDDLGQIDRDSDNQFRFQLEFGSKFAKVTVRVIRSDSAKEVVIVSEDRSGAKSRRVIQIEK